MTKHFIDINKYNIKKLIKMKKLFLFLFLFIFSCQPIDNLEIIVFDNSQLEKLNILTKNIEIKQTYVTKFSEPYIEHSFDIQPVSRLKDWIDENIKIAGEHNKLNINILDASMKRSEDKNLDAKKFDEQDIYRYELFFLVEYSLFDNSDLLLATTTVEAYRSTTSGKYISLKEKKKLSMN